MALQSVNIDVPEFNRRLTIPFRPMTWVPQGPASASLPYLGCMTGYLGNVYLKIPFDNSAIGWLNPIDRTKDSDASLTVKNTWGLQYKADEIHRLRSNLSRIVLSDAAREELFQSIFADFSPTQSPSLTWQKVEKDGKYPNGPTFVMIADNINAYTPEFPKNSGVADNSAVQNVKTYDFVQWLISGKRGIVMGSPVGRNQHHQSKQNFSLTQFWVWIPPQHCPFVLPNSWFISGTETVPTEQTWYDDVRKNLPHLKTTEEVISGLFRGAKPPMFSNPVV